MPAGVSWGRYLSLTGSALLAMFAGSQVVHYYYKPLADLDEYIARAEAELSKETSAKNWAVQMTNKHKE